MQKRIFGKDSIVDVLEYADENGDLVRDFVETPWEKKKTIDGKEYMWQIRQVLIDQIFDMREERWINHISLQNYWYKELKMIRDNLLYWTPAERWKEKKSNS